MGEWSVEFLRGVLDAAPEGIVVCESGEADQPVIYANAAFERLSGYSSDELSGQDLRRLQDVGAGLQGGAPSNLRIVEQRPSEDIQKPTQYR